MNYTVYHLHTDNSLLDSVTKYQAYVDKAVELGQTALAFTEHGNIYNWPKKKMACDKAGIKYIHGVECYLTETHSVKERDNFHTVLLAKNEAGVLEINRLVSKSTEESHFYYKPRISFDEFLGISKNVIKISACLASPLNKLQFSHPRYEAIAKHYDYFEVQAHDFPEQVTYNQHLAQLSQMYGIPLIAGTDTHSVDKYTAECRSILQLAKRIEFADEDSFDLTYKSYDELVGMFKQQDALPEQLYLQAIDNTNKMADSVEQFDLDLSFKYPKLYGKRDKEVFYETILRCLEEKVLTGAIEQSQVENFKTAISEECRVFDKIDMSGFMLFMSELVTWCKNNDIPVGFNRGSCGGSRVAFVTNITDLNPETWHTVFSRFANEDRKEIGDIDIDVSPSDRDKVYDYIIKRFGQNKTAFILALGTVKDKGAIDEICRALSIRWDKENLHDTKSFKKIVDALKDLNVRVEDGDARDCYTTYYFDAKNNTLYFPHNSIVNTSREALIKQYVAEYERLKKENEKKSAQNPWAFKKSSEIKDLYDADPESAKAKYPEVFYYFDGLIDTVISQSMHPAGIVASPITLADNYGVFESDNKTILQIDMDCVHETGLVKYDILGLKNVEIIKDAYKLIGKPYPQSHEIDWEDQAVWTDMLRSPVGIFQFEGDFAFTMLKQYVPHSVFDMSLVTAAIRPSGASYRDDLMKHKPNKNPSEIIDKLLEENNGYLVYQEDVIKFLQQICGMSGSDADNTRRAIGRKDHDRLQKALPAIFEGYCSNSPQPREVAEVEAKTFLQIIEDASSYMFGFNHSIGYCMIGYLCAYLRYYHPYEFITAYLNNANGEEDIRNGSDLALLYGIRIIPPKFGVSKDKYVFDKEKQVIAKGITSLKYLNAQVANELYEVAHKYQPKTFMEVLLRASQKTSLKTNQRDNLIKVDFFSDFGNTVELARIVDLFVLLKDGTAKKISKDKAKDKLGELIARYSIGTNKDGSESKSYSITDMGGLLAEGEAIIKSLNLPDVDIRVKMANQQEIMGYIDLTTGRKEDRRKLLITEVYPLISKDKGTAWGYAVITRSLGTGKTARLTIRSYLYSRIPVQKGDIVFAKELDKNKAGYWYLLDYVKVYS
jgi:DNA polymerase-3 subunit alpha